ncbi:MAG: hypothetical protein EZS28_036507 [Streblomastix strix]|uniref:Uncharacterized protein n=1 Tax=Streblomastix strix TaxID=222440 RepID=A0A5J4UAY9_9EUKA|nr:MAG: hypothetical protein EZS28_036507 [Streblomastix strix]
MEQLKNEFIAVDPKLKGKIDYDGIRTFQIIRRVEQNEGIPDPRFSDIQSSLPPKIIPNRIAREPDFNINSRLDQPSARTGDAAMPPDPDIRVREISHDGPQGAQIAEQIYKEQDGEQNPTTILPEENAIQQRLDEQPNQQVSQQINQQFNEVGGVQDELPESASQFIRGQMQQSQAKDQMGQEGFNSLQITLP